MTDLNSITNSLLLRYDQKFNEIYERNLNIKSSLSNKKELIHKANNEIAYKDKTILYLQYTIVLVIIFGVLMILYALKNITFVYLILYLIILILTYGIVIYYTSVKNTIKNFELSMNDYIAKIAGVKNKKCPSKCKVINIPEPTPDSINGYEQPTLNIDNQYNAWGYNEEEYESDHHPKNNRVLTYYECQWMGGDNNGDLPNMEPHKYSSIPCQYRANYEEKNRYICSKDPNNLGKSTLTDICNKV